MISLTEEDVRRIAAEVVGQINRGLLPGRLSLTEPGTYRGSTVRMLQGEKSSRMKRISPYGLISRPLPGMVSIIGSILGDATNLIYFGENDSVHRPQDLQPGEVFLYTDEGDKLGFRRGNEVHLDTGALFRLLVGAPPEEGEDDERTRFEADSEQLHIATKTVHVEAENVDIDGETVTIDGETIKQTASMSIEIDGGATVTIRGQAAIDMISAAITASNGGAPLALVTEAFMAVFNIHEHNGGGQPDDLMDATHLTKILKAE